MKSILLSCCALGLVALPLARPGDDPVEEAKAVLTDLHRAAAEGDGERYFGHLAPDAVYFGTAPDERWTRAAYVALLEPLFAQGLRLDSVPVEQRVFLSERGGLAWFEERLEKPKYGELRATGVLRKTADGWKVVQYHQTFPIPNEIVQDVVKLMRAAARK